MLQQMANTFDAGQVHTASVNDGYEALCLLNETTPDMLIAEISLPHKDGYALCRYVRQEPEFQSLPVILLDREFNAFNQRRALSVGADVYLSQPLAPDELIEAVHRLLESRGVADDGAADDAAWSAAQVSTRPQPLAFEDDEPTQPDFGDAAATPPPLPLPQRRPNRLSFVAAGVAAVLIGLSLLMLLRTTEPALAPDHPAALDKANGALATAGQPYVAAPLTEAQAGPAASAPSPEAASPSEPDATTSEPDATTPADTDRTAGNDSQKNDPQKVEAQPDEPRPSAATARPPAPAVGERRPSAASPRAGRSARRANHWRRGGEEMVASGEHFGSGAKHFSKGSAQAALWAGRKASGGVKRIGSAIKRIF